MKTKENFWRKKEDLNTYLSQINRDWWYLKGQLILCGILLAAIMCYYIWVM